MNCQYTASERIEQDPNIPRPEPVLVQGRPLHQRLDEELQSQELGLFGQMTSNSISTHSDAEHENYLLQVCRSFMMYGAPTYRLEEYMRATAGVLHVNLQSFYVPGCMIVSFGDTLGASSRVKIVRCSEALDLSKLYDVHKVYKHVIHQQVNVQQAISSLKQIMDRREKFPTWFRVLAYGLASAFIGPVSYGANPIDLPVIFILGCLLGVMELVFAKRSELYAHVFEISGTILISFLARAFGSIHSGSSPTFCFSAICQASLVLILPGLTITKSALELQSRNMVSGSVRMVSGIIFTLFLAFGVTVGAAVYGAFDTAATSRTSCTSTLPFWWQVIFVVPFTLCYILINQGKLADIPPTLALSLTGWLVNHFSAETFTANAQITQTIGALTVGVLANLYSRLFHGLALTLLYPAIFIQVPGSFAASGSLVAGVVGADDLFRSISANKTFSDEATDHAQSMAAISKASYSIIEIAIGITVGLSVSALLVYPIRKKKGASGIFSF